MSVAGHARCTRGHVGCDGACVGLAPSPYSAMPAAEEFPHLAAAVARVREAASALPADPEADAIADRLLARHPGHGRTRPIVSADEAERLRADVADLKRELAARARDEDAFRAQCLEAAQRYLAARGHEPTCHTTQHPDDPSEGCNCVVVDIERGCMGDVVAYLMRSLDDPDLPGGFEHIDLPPPR